MTMTPVLSLVAHISPVRKQNISNHMGRAVQWFALRNIFEAHSKALSSRLHPVQNALPQPYTASTIYYSGSTRPLLGTISSDDDAWLRITGINTEVVEALLEWSQNLPAAIELNGYLWHVHGVMTSKVHHPWAGTTDFSDLIQDHLHQRQSRELSMEFASPSAFHSESLHVPLPIPALVFRKLADCWNAYAPTRLDQELPTFARQFVEVAATSINTTSVYLKNEPIVGFVGRTRFRINNVNRGLDKQDSTQSSYLHHNHANLSRALALLTDFAFYSGIGIKTTMGMGMVRTVDPEWNQLDK